MNALCCIFNYRHSENALKWFLNLKNVCDTYILDTYVKDNPNSTDLLKYCTDSNILRFNNIYCGGLTIEAFNMTVNGGYDFLLIINSDVEYSDEAFNGISNRLATLSDDIGLYEVSALENSSVMGHTEPLYLTQRYYEKGEGDFKYNGYGEGWLYGIRTDIIRRILPFLSKEQNKHGWGIGNIIYRLSKKLGYKNVIDNKVFVYHPEGTGYDIDEALTEWHTFDRRCEEIGLPFFFITVGYCTREHNEEFQKHLYQNFSDRLQVIEKVCTPENGKTISEAYNEILKEARYETVLLIHDDVEIIGSADGMFVEDVIAKLFFENKEYGIIGLAPRGILERDIIQRTTAPEYFFQEVDYAAGTLMSYEYGEIEPYSFKLKEDAMVDGMFLAVRRDRIKKSFDEKFAFHFYDIDFCLANYLEGVKVGVTKAVYVRHKITSEEKYKEYRELKPIFLDKWKNKLPIII